MNKPKPEYNQQVRKAAPCFAPAAGPPGFRRARSPLSLCAIPLAILLAGAASGQDTPYRVNPKGVALMAEVLADPSGQIALIGEPEAATAGRWERVRFEEGDLDVSHGAQVWYADRYRAIITLLGYGRDDVWQEIVRGHEIRLAEMLPSPACTGRFTVERIGGRPVVTFFRVVGRKPGGIQKTSFSIGVGRFRILGSLTERRASDSDEVVADVVGLAEHVVATMRNNIARRYDYFTEHPDLRGER